ncbi:hypothetical protein ABZV77_05660 [Streptomyces sp. NPDC004732]|uniref:hypothetical protein n=1 Tax=Streptomyces sp. NPDC004732 TaxID=3154290 RepID=UPI0033A64F00
MARVVDPGVQLGALGLDGRGALRGAGKRAELVEGAGMGDGFAEVGQRLPKGAHRERELDDRTAGDVGFRVASASHGACGEGCRGGEVGDQSGDVASPVVEIIEAVRAGVHRVGERQFVGRTVDALGQRVQLADLVVREGQMDSWERAAGDGG